MRLIRASEVGEYVFCHRAWWLRHVRGFESTNVHALAAGATTHRRHGQRVVAALALQGLALLLVAAAVLALLASYGRSP